MPSRNNGQLIFAIIVTVLMFFGMCMIGLTGFPDKSGATLAPYASAGVTPLFSVPELQEPVLSAQNAARDIGQSDLIQGATVTPTTGRVKPSPIATMSPNPTVTVTLTANLARPNANTPTPIRVVVNTHQRSSVYYHGPATYVRADAFSPLPLTSLPRPASDNGRGLHWFPTTFQTHAVVDKFVPELNAMKIRWVVVLQGMNDWDMIANDYLIDRLNADGIQIVMRIDRQVGPMDWGRLGWIIARYRERGVRYFQIFNEPNAEDEWCTAAPRTPEQFVSYWIQAAEVVAANGGFPGFSPISPQPDDSDLAFFKAALEELKRLGRFDLVNSMWVSIHNYGGFDRANPTDDGFFRYRSYDAIVKQVFGGSLPMIITEGGLANADAMANVIAPMYQFVTKEREPFLLAAAPWLIGNAVGGGQDPRWEPAAWFTGTLNRIQPRSVVDQAKTQ